MASSLHTQIPNELLAEILYSVCDGALQLPLESQDVFSPWTLCRISSRWRQVALNEPRLWNRVMIESDTEDILLSIFMAHTAFSRSGNLPLELTISVYEDSEAYDDLVFTDPILTLITAYSTRFRFLSIWTPSTQLMNTVLHLPSESFISLESIHVGNRRAHRVAEDAMIWCNAPLLREVDIESGDDQDPTFPLTLHLPWTQLTTLKLANGDWVHPSVAHGVVAQTPQLIHYEVRVWGGHGGREVYDKVIDYPRGSITHPRLRRLHVYPFGSFDFDLFIQPLVLPALTEFDVSASISTYDEFVRFAERSQFQLQITTVFPENAQRDDPRLDGIIPPSA
ncbi:hypothetical protein FPV67DRAFT_569533 [Lyophyllum atratum]|nr:hypothetical protein FPV67DRAFT_569533 [Lyophyllum atratum]